MSVCLRAEWSIGEVLSRYFRFEAAGDMFVGKVAALLDPCSVDFAYLPAHFKATKEERVLSKIKMAVVEQFGEFLCGITNLMPVLDLSLALLLERKEYLQGVLGSTDPMLMTPLYRNPITFDNELVGFVHHEADDGMRSTGVPPYTAILVQNARVEKKLNSLPAEMKTMFNDELAEMVKQHGGLSHQHFTATIAELNKKIDDNARGLRVERHDNAAGGQNEDGVESAEPNPKRQCIPTNWLDGCGFRRFPKTFTYPNARVKQGWQLWWQGSAPEYVPFRIIRAKFDVFNDRTKERKAQVKLVTEWRRVFQKMEGLVNHMDKPTDLDRFGPAWTTWIAETFQSAYTPRLSHVVPAITDPQTRYPSVTYLAHHVQCRCNR
jgi:hypothetical protein